MQREISLSKRLPAVTRLGLATRGDNQLRPDDVASAVERGINYLNWCGRPDGLSRYVRESGGKRPSLVVAAQFKARSTDDAERELDAMSEALGGMPDILTFYYVESEAEWSEITRPGGVWETLARRRAAGELSLIGLTTHQRKLAARWAGESSSGDERRLDLLMVRYNAAHRGAERDVFPVTERLGIPVACFTGLRWQALLKPNPAAEGAPWAPSAPDCYRFCLSHAAASVVVTAPKTRELLEESLTLLDDWRPMSKEEMERIKAHGDWVRATAGEFW